MYTNEIRELAEKLFEEDLKTLVVTLLIAQHGDETLWWVKYVKKALNAKKGEPK